MPYLPNLASPDDTIYRKSVDSLLEEIRGVTVSAFDTSLHT